MERANLVIEQIVESIPYYNELSRVNRRSLNYISDITNIEHVFDENIQKNVSANIEILFKGFVITSLNYCDNFEMERLILPYYFSFYLDKPIYIQIKDIFFEVDYKKKHAIKIDTDTVPQFDLIILRSDYFTKNKECTDKYIKSSTKNIVIAPIQSYKQPVHYIFDNSFLFKFPGFHKYCEYTKYDGCRENIITIVGTLSKYKGQYEFIRDIDPDIIKNYVLLLGNKNDRDYYKKTKQLADTKNIKMIHHFIDPNKLDLLIPKCKYQVSYGCNSGKDANPRSITEGLYAGLPFLTTNYVTIPTLIQNNSKIGVVCQANNSNDLNEKMKQLLTLQNSDVVDFVKKKCNYSDICKYTINNILNKYHEI